MADPGGHATLCARVIIAELIRHGVTDLVLAPGSRSAPLAYEAFEADRIGLLRLHVRLDERTAGFLGLGLAKGSGNPVAVLTTSGTAPANLFPAVLEAAHAHQPLVLITASRPRALVNTGANQTTDQDQLFGRHARAYAALSDQTADPSTWRFEIARLMAAATGARTRQPGPVQLNVELSDPLVPTGFDQPPAVADLVLASARPGRATELSAGPQTVIVAGDAPPAVGREVAELAEQARVPLLAEPSSNARSGAAALGTARLLAGSSLAEEVERVVVCGHPTLSRPISRMLARDDLELVVVSAYADWVDPGRRASVVTDAVRFAEPDDTGWLARWRQADAELRQNLEALLAGLRYFSGPVLAAGLWTALGRRDVLFVGSSSPVRDLDLAPVTAVSPAVYANRGLAGIDGNVSTAAGIALAAEQPTHALLGDLTALHDLTGLLLPDGEPVPDLRLVVANDTGGSIFATLEPGRPAHSVAYERLFGTPHRADFAALAAGVGCSYARVRDASELEAALAQPPRGLELVEAVIDRSQRRTLDAAITGLAATF
ncbi:MAG TPA: 2-succinyl-5-enolpyruvyl-6-hydroxy-3-cyclohexene-1-carboxylic-acid synthase [Propionibacteriaceae bacterium]|nr:2-succinyl-5-enolpyruvyl-6-hydroxy-3-cyclohexene-1-carboxylic-acid synthase [Propionibacteriaceae bacterium]